jgi:rhodanese-related sulfurtransferase
MKMRRLAAGLLAIVGLAAPALAQTAGLKTVSSEAFSAAPGGATLIDIREPKEWAETGVPKDARLVASSRGDFVEAVLAELGGDKSKPVALICRSGARSLKSSERLVAAGFTNVINVGDGMIGRDGVGKGWTAAGLATRAYEAGQ